MGISVANRKDDGSPDTFADEDLSDEPYEQRYVQGLRFEVSNLTCIGEDTKVDSFEEQQAVGEWGAETGI